MALLTGQCLFMGQRKTCGTEARVASVGDSYTGPLRAGAGLHEPGTLPLSTPSLEGTCAATLQNALPSSETDGRHAGPTQEPDQSGFVIYLDCVWTPREWVGALNSLAISAPLHPLDSESG